MSKLRRAETRRLNRSRDHLRRRHEGVKRQGLVEGLSRAEFERRFPYLPLKAWYAQRGLIGRGWEY
ncbi:MAG: hypothetical protein WC517_00130 [Patescibacteria group bacterium]